MFDTLDPYAMFSPIRVQGPVTPADKSARCWKVPVEAIQAE
jgi:hypothetical protein